jgi:acyl-CoA synthetase (AMP-forming)/AMP-acid ligase II/acyl carrier protein
MKAGMGIEETLENAKKISNKTFAVLENSETLTFGDIYDIAGQISNLFKNKGLVSQDILLLSTTDKKSFIEILIGAYRFGLIVVLIDPNSKYERVQSIIKSTQPKAYLIDSNLKSEWNIRHENTIEIKREIVKKNKLFLKVFANKNMDDTNFYPAILNDLKGLPPQYPAKIRLDNTAYIIYTSGSTADPKGVTITHNSLFSHLATLQKVYDFNENTNNLNLLNLYHADGVNQGPLLSLFSGGTWFSPFPLEINNIEQIFYAIYKYRISHFFVVPTLLAFFQKYAEGHEDSFQTPDFKYMISVAAKLDPNLWAEVSSTFKVLIANIYGLTETVNGGLFCIPNTHTFKMDTVGKPIDCEIKVVDAEGNSLGTNLEGELLMAGNLLMKGYLNNPAATDKMLKSGWLYTGDTATIDEEGFVKITGRKKNMINAGGFRLHPEEIEEIILTIPGVFNCKVFGLEDYLMVEKIIAAIQPKEAETLNKLEVYEILRTKLEPEKIPHDIFFLNELPKGISGKVLVNELITTIKSMENAKEMSDVDMLSGILSTASKVFNLPLNSLNISSSSSNISGWDSLNHLVLITKLEEQFNVAFSTKELMNMISINAIHAILLRKIKP